MLLVVVDADMKTVDAVLCRAAEQAIEKEARVRPSGAQGARLLPGAVAVDTQDPFHAAIASATQSVARALGKALGSHLSESSNQMLLEAQQLADKAVFVALFGDAMKPQAGVAADGALKELLAACRYFLKARGGDLHAEAAGEAAGARRRSRARRRGGSAGGAAGRRRCAGRAGAAVGAATARAARAGAASARAASSAAAAVPPPLAPPALAPPPLAPPPLAPPALAPPPLATPPAAPPPPPP